MTKHMRLFDASDEMWDEMLNDDTKWTMVSRGVTYVDDHGEQTVQVVFHRLSDDTYWMGHYSDHPSEGCTYDESMCEMVATEVTQIVYQTKWYEHGTQD